MALDVKKKLKKERIRNFLSRDFGGFRQELLQYARTYFPNKIQDFSEASFGGLLLDMASMVGDTMSFYLDHQFNELNPMTAVENGNILRHLRNAGVKIIGPAPSSVVVNFYIEVPAEALGSGLYTVKSSSLPIIFPGTILESANGTRFNLVDSVDFSEVNSLGAYKADIVIGDLDANGNPSTYIMTLPGLCISGEEIVENFSFGVDHVPFRRVTMASSNVTDIIDVSDSDGNKYYQVESLSQDTVFKGVLNVGEDGSLVPYNLEIIPCPYRYVASFDPITRLTTLSFGAGDAESLDNDIIPDPSKLSLNLYGKTSFSRFSIDPNSLLETSTLGISPRNTTLRVLHRSGGGLSHNVPAESIRFVKTLKMDFRKSPSAADATFVRGSIDVKNPGPARGGDRAPTLDELRRRVTASRQMQSRIVTKQDMLTRIYTLPSKFGRVFRAGIRENPANPLSTQLYVISRDDAGNLDVSPDSLKLNLSEYLNEYRLISDAIDVLDAQITNFTVRFGILTTPNSNKILVVDNVIKRLSEILNIDNFQIDQPIMIDDIVNVIINTQDVLSLVNLDIVPIAGIQQDRTYSINTFNFKNSTKNRVITGPPGSIFELKYPEFDIIGSAT